MKLCDRCRVKNCGLLYLGEGCQTVRKKECPDIIPQNGDLLSVMDAGEMAQGIMALVNDLYQDEIPREEAIQEWLEMEAVEDREK